MFTKDEALKTQEEYNELLKFGDVLEKMVTEKTIDGTRYYNSDELDVALEMLVTKLVTFLKDVMERVVD